MRIVSGLIVLGLVVSQFSFAGEKVEAMNTACSAEVQATGCSDKKVGKGLLKCMHVYKKQHKDFKFSDACKDAMKDLRHSRK